jgi:hypothetical protein
LAVPNSSLSFHLGQLSRAGLLRQERRHRSLIYRADFAAMNALVGYLMENCCGRAGCAAPFGPSEVEDPTRAKPRASVSASLDRASRLRSTRTGEEAQSHPRTIDERKTA